MSFRSAFVDFLKTTVGNNRVYSMRLPQTPTWPSIVYTFMNQTDQIIYEGALPLIEAAVQLDFWSKQTQEVDAIEGVVKEALVGYKGPMGDDITYTAGWKRESLVDMYESDTGLYRISVDYRGRYSEV